MSETASEAPIQDTPIAPDPGPASTDPPLSPVAPPPAAAGVISPDVHPTEIGLVPMLGTDGVPTI